MVEPDIYPIPGFSEPVSSLSHLLGAGIFFVFSLFLLRRGRGHWGRLFSLWVFTFAGVFLLSMSGVYHLLQPGSGGRAVLQRLDHSAIFVLIAGTFTPVHAILFRGWLRWLPLLLIWLAAATGITLKVIFFDDVSEWFGLALYLGLGWIGIASGVLLYLRFGWPFVRPLVLGALAYTLGAILEFQRWPIVIPGVVHAHELFHLAVLAGLFLHWRFILQFAAVAVPAQAARPRPVEANGTPRKDHAHRAAIEAQREAILVVLETRFGSLPAELSSTITKVETTDHLEQLLRQAAVCASFTELQVESPEE